MSYNKQYSQFESVFGSDPDKFLVDHYSCLDKKLPVLDIGAGQGRNSFYLAEMGYMVDAIDPSSVAVEIISQTAKNNELPVTAYESDFQAFDPQSKIYGGILLFGLIQILNRNQIESLKQKMDGWLAPKGHLFVSAFTVEDNTSGAINKENITYLEQGEILRLFKGYETVYHWEGLGPEHHHGDGILERHAKVEAVFQKK